MKKLLFTLAALLIAGNAMADRVVTFDAEYDDMEEGAAVCDEYGEEMGHYWTMSKDGVVISIFSANASNPCTEDGYYFVAYYSLPESEANLEVFSELYSVDEDAPSYERYYGGIRKIELDCSPAVYYGPGHLTLLRPHLYGAYTTEGNMGYYNADSEEGFCPQFVDFGGGSTKIYTITVTLYGVEDDTPVDPVIPTARMLTVCDGTATNNYVPIYGLYVDTEGTMGQMIYPAEMLSDMVGSEITELKFYTPGINFSNAMLQVGLAAADKDNFDDYAPIDGATILGTVVPSEGDNEVTFVFDEPYLYEGGNLMIQVVVIEPGNWKTTYFYGEDMPYYYSLCQYQTTWSTSPSTYHEAFLPKVTFTYNGGEEPVEPTEKTGAPVFNGFTTDGIHAYFVEIIPTEESVIYYRVLYPDTEEYTPWEVYTDVLDFVGDGKHRVEAYAVAPNKLPSEQIAYEFVVEPVPPTSISEMVEGKTVERVRYYNMAGQEMSEANGLTIMVTTYTDGTTSAVKVVK